MNLEPLFEIVLETATFAELSGENTIDPDAAVELLESLSASLQRLDAVTLKDFREFAERFAQLEQDAERRKFITQFCDIVGIGPD